VRGANHTYIRTKGKRVIVWLKAGGSIRGRYVETTDRYVVLEDRPRISRKLIRTVTIDREPPQESEPT
jgi:hypothetical protein